MNRSRAPLTPTTRNAADAPATQGGFSRRDNLRWLAAGGMVAATGLLSACGGSKGSSATNAQVRLVNATLTHPNLDLLNGGAVIAGSIAADTASSYASVTSGASTLQVNDAGSSTALFIQTPSLASAGHYTLLAYEVGGQVYGYFMGDDLVLPTAGTVLIRVIDLAVQAGKVDVYITTSAVTQASALAGISPVGTITTFNLNSVLAFAYAPGTYYVSVTATGNPADVRMLSMPVTLTSQQIGNVVLTPTSGGGLVNGNLVIMQSTVTAFRTTTARVRLASSVSGNATVGATATSGGQTTSIDAGSVSPAFGAFKTVPVGASLNVTVNGASVSVPSTALAAGSDTTLFVYGTPGAATVTALVDDNRPPADPTQVKIRFINGIAGTTTTPLSLTANSTPVASNVAAGTAAAYASVPGSANPMYFNVYSPQAAGIYFSNSSNVLNANSVYTVLVGGSFASPVLMVG